MQHTDDVLAPNAVIRLPAHSMTQGLQVAGATWLADRLGNGPAVRQARREALRDLAELGQGRLEGYLLWLLAAHTARQRPSRIIHHRKLWGGFAVLPKGRDFGQEFVENADGLRYFGALQIDLDGLDAAIDILEQEPVSQLVLLPPNGDALATSLIREGWEYPPFGPSPEVLARVVQADGVVLWPLGAFDDAEAGAVAFAKPERIARLAQ
jgi:hypothetical protein